MARQIYSIPEQGQFINAGDAWAYEWQLQNIFRNMKIYSLLWDIVLRNTATGKIINLTDRADFPMMLFITGLTGSEQLYRTFINATIDGGGGAIPLIPNGNGRVFYFWNPGRYEFNSFFISEDLKFHFEYQNLSVNQMSVGFQMTIEVEETPKFD